MVVKIILNILPELAMKIIREVQQVINEDIIVVDLNSVIIASTDSSRIGTFHEGAQRVLKSKKKLYINKDMISELKGVKEGINMPIMLGTNLIGVVGVTGNPKEVEPFAEMIRRMTELILQEARYTEQMEWKNTGLQSYFYEWVNLTHVDRDFLDRGILMDIPVHQTHICCLIQVEMSELSENDTRWIEREYYELFHHFFSEGTDYIIRFGQGRYLLLKNCKKELKRSRLIFELEELQKSFANKFNSYLYIGVGKTPGTYLINQSYKEAKKALKVSEKQHQIVFYEDLIIDVVLEEVSLEMQKEYIDRTIKVLMRQPELLVTLQSYINNNQSIKETSKELHLHINTLHYRLKQIKDLTSIDPKETEGIVLFYLAMMFFRNLEKDQKSRNAVVYEQSHSF